MPSDLQSRELQDIFVLRLEDNHEFRSWLLSRTKFARLWPLARIVRGEPAAASEGGLLVGFELEQTRLRFGVFVAIAKDASDLERTERLRQRACEASLGLLNVMDFETVLLAPQALILDDRTLAFDRRIPFETVAGFLPEFGRAERLAA